MNEFFYALTCEDANPTLPPSQRIFEPLIGNWDLEVTWFDEGRPVRFARGEWYFSWVLEGRAVQDVWIVPPRSDRSATTELYEYGTSIRFYDVNIGAWRSTWIGPVRGLILSFVVREHCGEIVLETTREDGHRMQWVFSEISSDRFCWRNELEVGGAWETQQSFLGTRKA